MFTEIQLDSKRRQKLVARMRLRLRLLKLRHLKLEAALTTKKKPVSEILSTTDQQRKEDQGRIEKPHEEMFNQTRIKKHNKFLALHFYSHTGKIQHGISAVRYPCGKQNRFYLSENANENVFSRFFANGFMLQSTKMTQSPLAVSHEV